MLSHPWSLLFYVVVCSYAGFVLGRHVGRSRAIRYIDNATSAAFDMGRLFQKFRSAAARDPRTGRFCRRSTTEESKP